MTQHMVTIKILGKEYTINCPKGQQEQLRRSAEALQERLLSTQKKTMLQSNQNILVMTALNMSHELLEAQALLDLIHTDKADDKEHKTS
ncbi:MAG: cell division protein ZapA [Alteromonadaceae bacterium]|jgi:cell division protein ZapA